MENSEGSGKIVTFGEVLMRLSPSDNRVLQQATQMDFFFGGTEMNVAASLAHMGLTVQHITNVSNDIVGEAALASLRKFAIDVSRVRKVEEPLGLYFMEVGSAMRSSKIVYNRLHSCFAHIKPGDFDWEAILEGCSCFHWTGISPAISEGAYQTLKAALKVARHKGIPVTTDPAYRSNLWQYGRTGHQVLAEMMDLSTIFIGGVNEINEILQADYEQDQEGFIAASKALIEVHPTIEKVFDKVRTGVSASWQKVYGRAWTGSSFVQTPELEITPVVDRIGTGDAYAAGVIYGLQHFDDQTALNFANAACALKHTHVGDANLVSVADVMEIVQGNTSGRIKR